MATLPSIEAGKRVIVSGRTGSGKTTLASWLVSRSPQQWIILNPKHTAGYHDALSIKRFDANKLDAELKRNKIVSIDFAPEENNPEFMDDVISYLHNKYDNMGLLADELYTLHKNGRPGAGLVGWLTRGRERKQSFIGLTQRPAWISIFCFSEADYICGMSLNREEDRKRLVANSGNDAFLRKLDARQWLWYDVNRDRHQLWGPVPLTITTG